MYEAGNANWVEQRLTADSNGTSEIEWATCNGLHNAQLHGCKKISSFLAFEQLSPT